MNAASKCEGGGSLLVLLGGMGQRFIPLPEVERLTGISANAMRIRKARGKPTPFDIYKVEGLGLAVRANDLRAYIANLQPVTTTGE